MTGFGLDKKVAVITGAAGEVGSATARLFARQDARLLLADLADEKVKALALEIGSRAAPFQADFSRVTDCRACIEAAVERFGQLDILVNNVGICPRISFLDSTEEDWERIVAVNQKSMFFCSQFAAPFLRQTKGRIISLASYAGRAGAAANASIYSGTKGAVIALTKAIARELAPDVLVNAVAPGALDTGMVHALPQERLDALIETIPLKRLGKAEEVASAILFLAAADCSYLTGATLDMNGGWMMI